jgi:hypothetical protein
VSAGGQLAPATIPHHDQQPRVDTHSRCGYAEIRLTAWAYWAKGQQERLGYPYLSLTYKVMRRRAKRLGVMNPLELELRLKGLTARGSETRSLRPRTVGEVSEAIALVDRIVAVLEHRHKRIIHIEYLSPECPQEAKAAEAGMFVAQYRRALKRAKLAVANRLDLTQHP